MIWVIGVVVFRAIRGTNDEDEVDYNIFVIASKDVDVAPPAYEDEKQPLVEESAQTAEAN